MRSKMLKTLTCLALLAFCVPMTNATSHAEEGQQAMDHASIQSTIEANNNAVEARDMERILATYEPTALMVSQPGLTAVGTPALREAFGYFLALEPKITVTKQEVVQTGDIALHSYAWTMKGKSPEGHPIEQKGLSIVVLRKQKDGRWLMVIDNPFGDAVLR
jgi:uncharacterized protein (TIGR02246 family)